MNNSIPKFDEFLNEKDYSRGLLGGHEPKDLKFIMSYMYEIINIMAKKMFGETIHGLGRTKDYYKIVDLFNKKYNVDYEGIITSLHI